ncbi:MAG TPA: malto-oligosyltrehalose synthase [Stellaceae bacterium]|nr:malto-oligosyltrehalose synthase [Stellaceae bacterium]
MARRSPFDPPLATYRLQLHRDFTFAHATAILPYLARLGISHVYCSPFLKARAGSSHGYDIVDYSRINPELGDEASFARFCASLVENGLGLILDFVPNHMGIGHADNAWWLDVLEWGEASPYARYFDIDWSPPRRDLAGKVLVPILGKSYGATLAAGEIELRFDAAMGTFDFYYADHRLPVTPPDYRLILGDRVASPAVTQALASLGKACSQGASHHLRQTASAAKEALADAAREPATAQAIAAAVASWRGTTGDAPSWRPLHDLLQRQFYRLAQWRTASDEVNYRRFFDIPELAGMRMERFVVFRDTHAFLGRLLADGVLQGLRIDHVDGLADPQRYCRRLNAFAAAIVPRDPAGKRLRPYILVEKILIGEETLPQSWPVSGTTGYDYLALANGLFIDAAGFAKLQRHWHRFTAIGDSDDEVYRCRLLVIDRNLGSELTYLVSWLVEICEADWFTRDYTPKRLRDALVEIVAAFPVYRTYVTERGTREVDRAVIAGAIAKAHARWQGADGEILDFIADLLTLDIRDRNARQYRSKQSAILRFVARFQQYTGAIAAKAVEDTFFYRFVPLVSANEVGASAHRPATAPAMFHERVANRAAIWPLTMLASATHDTKRGEDIRARLDVLSEMPDEWARRVARWHVRNRGLRSEAEGRLAPSANDEYLLYQSIVGTWPMQPGSALRSSERRDAYVARLKAFAVKAAREAKLVTSWIAPDAAYEAGLERFIERLFDPPHNPFTDSVARFLPPILRLGAFNSLAQLVLKATVPGVPDFYQGCEFWDLSLVDPDNRRPVDYEARRNAIAALDFASALARWREGWLKLWLIERLLAMRNRRPNLFLNGSYKPILAEGSAAAHVVAFERRDGDAAILVVVACQLANLVRGDLGAFWPDGSCVGDTSLHADGAWLDELTGARVTSERQTIPLSALLSRLPVAILRAE